MEPGWILLTLALLAAVAVVVVRRHRKRRSRRYLCHGCRYDHLDICTLPQRPYAVTCEEYMSMEDEEAEWEEEEEEESPEPWKTGEHPWEGDRWKNP